MTTQVTRRAVAVATAGLVAFAMFLLMAGPASATHVNGVWYDGNVNCEAAPGTSEILRLEGSDLENGTHNAGGGSITVSNLTDKTFDWSSSGVVISAVFVKAGNGGYLYNYLPGGETSDTGLDSGAHAISHITFCSGGTSTTSTSTTVPEETTTVPEETTTVPEETTTVPEVTTTFPDEVSPTEVTPTTDPEVSPTEAPASTLPFTGAASENLAMIALVLAGGGVLFLVASRGIRE